MIFLRLTLSFVRWWIIHGLLVVVEDEFEKLQQNGIERKRLTNISKEALIEKSSRDDDKIKGRNKTPIYK